MSGLGATPGISVISVCALEHLAVWQKTSRLLPDFIEADEFTVYVPDEHIEEFCRKTHPAITIEAQGSITQGFDDQLVAAIELAENTQRLGWYRQQLIKIEALIRSNRQASIIWDADCVPLRPMKFFDADGRPVFLRTGEYHRPYFEAIERLLGLQRIQEHSFVAPAFPIRTSWIKEFITDVELRSDGRDWAGAIIASIDFGRSSGFSEYETIGTWVSHARPGEWTARSMTWERLGRSRFGGAEFLSVPQLLDIGARTDLEMVCFEDWDEPSVRTRLHHGRNRVLEFIGRHPNR